MGSIQPDTCARARCHSRAMLLVAPRASITDLLLPHRPLRRRPCRPANVRNSRRTRGLASASSWSRTSSISPAPRARQAARLPQRPGAVFQPGNAPTTRSSSPFAEIGDLPHKAQILARTPKTTELLLAGPRGAPSADAERVGGEPLLLQRRLVEKYGVDVRRTIVWSGSRVTNHNLLAALAYAKQVRDFSQRRTDTTFVEERFLVRREAASLAHLLGADAAARDAVASASASTASAHAALPRSRAPPRAPRHCAGAAPRRVRSARALRDGARRARRPPTEAGSARAARPRRARRPRRAAEAKSGGDPRDARRAAGQRQRAARARAAAADAAGGGAGLRPSLVRSRRAKFLGIVARPFKKSAKHRVCGRPLPALPDPP